MRGWEHVTAADLEAHARNATPATRSKYRNVRTTIDGQTFDSKGEADRWVVLGLMQRAGEARNLRRQVPFALTATAPDGTAHQVGLVIIDYVYEARHPKTGVWSLVVEDFKGAKTLPFSRWKYKHFAIQYGIPVSEMRSRRRDA